MDQQKVLICHISESPRTNRGWCETAKPDRLRLKYSAQPVDPEVIGDEDVRLMQDAELSKHQGDQHAADPTIEAAFNPAAIIVNFAFNMYGAVGLRAPVLLDAHDVQHKRAEKCAKPWRQSGKPALHPRRRA